LVLIQTSIVIIWWFCWDSISVSRFIECL